VAVGSHASAADKTNQLEGKSARKNNKETSAAKKAKKAKTNKNHSKKKAIKTDRQSKRNSKKTKTHKEEKAMKTKTNSKKTAKKLSLARQSTGCLASNCLDLSVAYIVLLQNKVTNYQKQVARLAKVASGTASKSAKKDGFKTAINQLLTTGGGNAANLSCSSNTTNAGIWQHREWIF
jgi:hypothetical protein